jgi:hypothetical protein
VPRSPENICIVGAQETGKTTLADQLIQASNRKTLIVDSDGLEKTWHKYPLITLEQLPRARGGKHRIIYDEENPDFIKLIRKYFRNGFLVFDDAAFFLADRRAEHFRKILIKNRQTNNDIITIFHVISVLILFNTTDSFERNRKAFPDEKLMIQRIEQVRQMALKNRFARKVYRLR